MELPIAKFSDFCAELGIYAFDTDADAWVLVSKIKGEPPQIGPLWDTRILGPRPRIQPHEDGFYRLHFEIHRYNNLGELIEVSGQHINNTFTEDRSFFVIKNLPIWMQELLSLPDDLDRFIIVLSEKHARETQ